MNHCVPEFEMEEDDSSSTSFGRRHKKSSPLQEDELVELLWQNGQVVHVHQSQNQRSVKKSPTESTAKIVQPTTAEEAPYQVFMQEDEMASWLHYPLDDDFCADLLYPSYSQSSKVTQIPGTTVAPPPAPPPIPPPTRRVELLDSQISKFHNFMHFSRPKTKIESSQPPVSDQAVRESTVVDSSDTPVVMTRGGKRKMSHVKAPPVSHGAVEQDREMETCDLTVTSSSGGSGARMDERKRKASRMDDHDCNNDEDAKFDPTDTKKLIRGSSSARRSRASEVHNLSERRRRDRINEKMKALQELIPRCNKSDKASMLDEAIEYLKSLQLQVQMMSMGCSMVPMVFPGVQQYMSPMGIGMGMGMGMGMAMDMGLSRPMLPFPHVLASSSMPRPAAAAHLGPRLPMPAFHLPSIPSANGPPMQGTTQSDQTFNSFGTHGHNPLQIPSFIDPYQHYMSLHQMQTPPCPSQNQMMAQPSTTKRVSNSEKQKHG